MFSCSNQTTAGGSILSSKPTCARGRQSLPRWFRCVLIFLQIAFGLVVDASAIETVIWKVTQTSGDPQVTSQPVTDEGATVQRFRCEGTHRAAFVELSGAANASLLHDEFRAELRVRTNVPGVRFGLRIVLPEQIDPRTGRPLETIIRGSVSKDTEEWQTLSVTGSRQDLATQLRRVRAELHRSDIESRGAVAVGLAILIEVSPDATFVDIGESQYGPVIAPPADIGGVVEQLHTDADSGEPDFVPLKVELNRIMLADRPVILRFAPDHGEDTGPLKSLGLNAAWVQDYRNTERAAQLKDLGLAVIATPPHPEFEPGDYSRLLRALPPLDQLCPSASAWYNGTRVPQEQLGHLLSLSREVRSADRRFQRPHMADVVSAEGAASREIDLIGVGRHVVGRCESFGELRNDLFRRRRLAGQLTFPWTWIQTEPSGTQQRYRAPDNSTLPFVEPEQILLQVHAAVSAGCKGIGFWKTRKLDPSVPQDRETLLAIELASRQLSLLEPFLAEGRIDGHLAITNQSRNSASSGGDDNQPAFLQSALNGRRASAAIRAGERPAGPDAAVISSGSTMLILMTHWDNESQYVPTPMFHSNASLVVAASETASAWRITASGIEGLPRRVTAGGLVVRIDDFDQHAAVIVSSDPQLIRKLDRNILQLAPRSAAIHNELALLKLERVSDVVARLRTHITPPESTNRLLVRAETAVRSSTMALERGNHRDCIASAEQAMRLLRECQYLCWHQAIDTLNAPTASPHTISFTTLPDHWKMVNQLRDRLDIESANLLPSGTFENARLLSEDGWQRERTDTEEWLTAADVVRDPGSGNSLLRLACWQPQQRGENTTSPFDGETPLVVKSPVAEVQVGDILRFTGRVRLGRGVTPGSERPLLLFDSVLGPEHGLRPEFLSAAGQRDATDQKAGRGSLMLRDRFNRDWMTFEFFREAKVTGPVQFAAAITTSAEIQLDDVSVTRLPQTPTQSPVGPVRMTGQTRR
jgi:hypothetical protein